MSFCHFLPQFLLQETLSSCVSEFKDGKKSFPICLARKGHHSEESPGQEEDGGSSISGSQSPEKQL